MDAIVIGIDVSKDWLDVAVRPTGERFRVSRDAEGLDRLLARLSPLAPTAVGLEATGGYETVVAATLAAAGLAVAVVNPAQVRAFAQAVGRRAKTDPIDAASSPTSSRRRSRMSGRCRMRRRGFSCLFGS
jgi:transposase